MIRPATAADIPEITRIWNWLIRDTTISFNPVEKTEAMVAETLAEKAAADQPFFVALADGDVVGFASYAQFRGGLGYAHAMEHSICLSPKAWGRGLGRALMAEIEAHARARDVHTLWAGVSGENPDGVAFHAALGFETVGVLPEVGRKFDRWLDLTLMVKRL